MSHEFTATANSNNNFIPIRGTVISASDDTTTDPSGNFNLADVDSNDVPVFSLAGYAT